MNSILPYGLILAGTYVTYTGWNMIKKKIKRELEKNRRDSIANKEKLNKYTLPKEYFQKGDESTPEQKGYKHGQLLGTFEWVDCTCPDPECAKRTHCDGKSKIVTGYNC